MPRNLTTGVFTRVSNTFSEPVYGTVIDPTDAIALFDDQDGGMTFDDTSPLILIGSTSGVTTIKAADIASGTITLPAGTTDFSATGGTGQVVKQDSAGGPFTVATISTGDIVNPAALTRTDDTNVTLTLGGTPSTALLQATSLTLGWSGQLAPSRGGTGIASYAVGDILYASGATTLSKLADVATGNALISGGVTTAPAWGKIGLTTHVSGNLPLANMASVSNNTVLSNISGGASTPLANTVTAILDTIGGTQGNVLYRNGTVWTVLAPGTNGQVLTSGGAAANITWTSVAGTGTVTSVAAGTGMSFSTITTTGSVAIDKATAANYYAATSNKVLTTDIVYPSEVTVTYGTTTTFDFDTFINAAVTLTGNITTMTFSNIRAGKAGAIRFIQDGSGSKTTVWNSNLKWASGAAPTLSTAANAVDVLVYQTINSTYIVASLIKGVA